MPRLVYLLCVCLLVSCIALAPRAKAQMVTPARMERMQELRPRIKLEDTAQTASQTRRPARPGAFKLRDNARIDSLMDTLLVYNQRIKGKPGYRLQVYTGVDREAAMKAKETLYRSFPQQEVYVTFVQPTFQVRSGDFLTRDRKSVV